MDKEPKRQEPEICLRPKWSLGGVCPRSPRQLCAGEDNSRTGREVMFQHRSTEFDPRVSAIACHLRAIEKELGGIGRSARRYASGVRLPRATRSPRLSGPS